MSETQNRGGTGLKMESWHFAAQLLVYLAPQSWLSALQYNVVFKFQSYVPHLCKCFQRFLSPAPSIPLGGWLSTAICGSREVMALLFSSFCLPTLFSLGPFWLSLYQSREI